MVDSCKCPENHCFSYDYQRSHFSQTAGFTFSNEGKSHCHWRDPGDHVMGFDDDPITSFDHNLPADIHVPALDLVKIESRW